MAICMCRFLLCLGLLGTATVKAELVDPDATPQTVKLFEGPIGLPTKSNRKYYTAYDGKKSRYIWAEFSFVNQRTNEDWFCEVFFNFYNDARQLKGRTQELVRVKSNQKTIEICSGWGSDRQGTWYYFFTNFAFA